MCTEGLSNQLQVYWISQLISQSNSQQRYNYIMSDIHNNPACSQGHLDSTDTNTVETSTCLETTQQETTNFTVQLSIG